jgi:hypothetical protein
MTIVTSSGGRSAACQLATLSGFVLGMVKADQE